MILLLLFFVFVAPQNLLQFNSTIQRYKSILFPHTGCYYLPNTTRDVSFLVSPKFPLKKNMDTQDLCLDIPSLVPELPLNETNFCRNYFCSSTKPLLYQNITNPGKYLYDSQLTRKDPRIKHLLVQQYCLKCEASYLERFDLFIQNNTCLWLEVDYCQNKCEGYSGCVTLMHYTPLCYYSQRNQFFVGDTNLINLGIMRMYFVSYFGFSLGILLFILNVILLIIPEVYKYISLRGSEEYNTLTFFQKVKYIFGLRFQIIFWNTFISLGFILTGLLDIINFAIVVITTIMVLISIIVEVYIWVLIIILWLDVIKRSSELSTEYSELSFVLKIFWFVFTILTVIVAALGAILYLLTLVIRDNNTFLVYILNIILSVTVSIMLILLILVSLFLWVVSIYLFIKIRSSDININDLKEITAHYFKLNLTRNIIVINILVIPTFLVGVLLAISILNYELISLPGLFICHLLIVLFCIFLSFWITITMTNINYLKNVYLCCLRK